MAATKQAKRKAAGARSKGKGRGAPGIRVPAPWQVHAGGKRMSLRLKTKDFLAAMDVMNELARVAEELDHHPDLHLERWNRLRITTYSHDVGHLTRRDERLARRINEILVKRGLLEA